MQKVIGFLLTVLAVAVFVQPAAAQMAQFSQDADGQAELVREPELHGDIHESLDIVLVQLLAKYDTDTASDLSCAAVSNDDFERLGDAVMESMHPGQAHEAMDAMLGGEGSARLAAVHIGMGKNYLGCTAYNNNFAQGGGMMGGFGMGSWGFVGGIWAINGVLVGILLVVLIRYFWNRGNK